MNLTSQSNKDKHEKEAIPLSAGNGFTFLYHIIQVSHVVQVRAAQKLQKQHALKGQKLLAQGIALGMMAISKTPCKGKSFMFCLEF